MAGPWERYQGGQPAAPAAPTGPAGPWQRYAQGSAPAQPAPAPEEPSLVDTIMGYVGPVGSAASYGAQELARGVTQMVGAPVDLVNASPMLGNLLPGEQGMTPMSEDPVGGSEWLWDLVTKPRDAASEALGSEAGDREPQNAVERIGGRMANEVGAAAVPVGGAIAAGTRLGVQGARQMQRSGSQGSRIAGRMAEGAAVDPARYAARETAYAAGAGTGAGAALELASDGNDEETTRQEALAEIIGAVLGYGGVGTLESGAAAAGNATAALTGIGRSRRVEEAVVDELARATEAPIAPSGAADTSGAADAIRNGRRAGEVVPGYRDTTADVLQNPQVAALEYNRQTGPNAGMHQQRRADNQAAANAALEDVQPTARPGAYSAEARQRRDDQLARLDQELQAVTGRSEAAEAGLRPRMTSEARGQTIRGELQDALGTARQIERDAWSEVRGQVDTASLAQRFQRIDRGLTESRDRVVSDMGAARGTPGRLSAPEQPAETASSILDAYGRPMQRPVEQVSRMTDLAQVTDLRSEFTGAIRQAQASGDANKANVLQQYVDEIDAFLDGVPAVAEPLRAARAVSRDLNDRFTRRGNAIADTLATRGGGGAAVPDSNVAGQFVQPNSGRAANIDELLAETSSDGVRDALRDQIVDEVSRRGLLQKPDRLDEFLGQYSRVFEKFPDLRQEFGTAAGLRRQVDAGRRGYEQTQRELTSPSGSTVGRYLSFGDERAKDAMLGVLNARDPAAAADELLRFVDDTPQAIEGARSAFWEAMKSKTRSTGTSTRTGGGEQAWRFQDIANFIDNPGNAAVMERLYRNDPEHLENIRGISEALSHVEFGKTGRVPNSSGTPQSLQGNAVLPSPETIGAYSFAYQRGQVGLPYIGLRLISTMGRKAMMQGNSKIYQELIDRALLEPDLAERLMREHNPANAAALMRWARGAQFAQADDLADLLEGGEPDEDDEMMEAIGRQ